MNFSDIKENPSMLPRNKIFVFISQPMRDRTDEEILKERKTIIDSLAFPKPVELIQTFYDFSDMRDINGYINEPLLYLGRAIIDLASADIVVFAPGWEKARGCKIEHECAISYGIPIWYYQPDLSKLKIPCLTGVDTSRGDDFCAT